MEEEDEEDRLSFSFFFFLVNLRNLFSSYCRFGIAVFILVILPKTVVLSFRSGALHEVDKPY